MTDATLATTDVYSEKVFEKTSVSVVYNVATATLTTTIHLLDGFMQTLLSVASDKLSDETHDCLCMWATNPPQLKFEIVPRHYEDYTYAKLIEGPNDGDTITISQRVDGIPKDGVIINVWAYLRCNCQAI